MAVAVCQGSSSWSDPGFHLTQDPIPFNLRLSSSYSSTAVHRDFHGLAADRSFLEAILTQKQGVYVHAPVVNPPPPSLRLSPKSLELCTENLGNETGSDMSDSESVDACVFSTTKGEQVLKPSQGEPRTAKKYAGFPPPLTTIKGKDPIRFNPRREQGRLVLEAVKMSPTNSIFQAERSQGRLTLCFLDDSAPISSHGVEEGQEHRNQEKEEEDEDDAEEADRHAMETTFKMLSRCKDGDHRHHQLQQENRGLLSLGDVMGGHLLNLRLLFLVALLTTIC